MSKEKKGVSTIIHNNHTHMPYIQDKIKIKKQVIDRNVHRIKL